MATANQVTSDVTPGLTPWALPDTHVPKVAPSPRRTHAPLAFPVLLLIALAGLLTVLDALGQVSALGYESAPAHAAVASIVGFSGLLAALLIFGRFWHYGELWCLLASLSLALLGATNLAFAVPTSEATTPFLAWFSLNLGLAGTILLAAAAIVPLRRVERPLFISACSVAGVAAVVVAAGVGTWVLRGKLPLTHSAEPPGRTVEHWLSAPMPMLALQLASGAAFTLAAFGFQRRSHSTGDELMMWLAAGALVGGLVDINFALFPSNLSRWIYVGDLLTPAFFGLVFVGAVREVAAYQKHLAAAAALAERGRLARDLHDGIAQDLAFIAMQTRLANQHSAASWIGDVTSAAERALAESQTSLRILASGRGSLVDTIVATAEDVAHRAGASVRIVADDDLETSVEAYETLMRIVREAVTNAVRHGLASTVTIGLHRQRDGLRVTIADDGIGFDPLAHSSGGSGFGLTSMSARAAELGGHLSIESRPGAGTCVEVSLP